MKKLKVLEMIDRPFLGGGQAVLLALARHLDRARFEVAVCAQGGGPLEEEVRKIGLDFWPASFRRRPSLRPVRDVRRHLAANGVDILHTHGGVAGVFGRMAARAAGTPVIVHTIHGIHYLHYRNPVMKKAFILLERFLSRKTSAVVFVSIADLMQAAKYRLAKPDRLRLVRNGAAGPPESDPGRNRRIFELRLKFRSPLVGSVARLHRQKGVADLIQAADPILRGCPEATIVVAGGGPLESRLRKDVVRRGLDRRVLLLGERADAGDLMSLFDVFVLPSLWEGLPLVLIEAAALGKPIVATRIDGTSEVIRDGETGLLVPSRDPGALAEAVLGLLRDPDRARGLGERARKEIPPAFSLDRMIAETEKLYLDLAAGKRL